MTAGSQGSVEATITRRKWEDDEDEDGDKDEERRERWELNGPLQARNRRSKLRMDRVDPSAPGTKNSEQPNGQIEEKKKRKKKKQKTTCSATQLCTLRVFVFAAKGESILSRLAIASNFPVTTVGLEQ
jgi:single-stranded DNA-binding protein